MSIRQFATLFDLSPQKLCAIVHRASELKTEFKKGVRRDLLRRTVYTRKRLCWNSCSTD